MDGERWGFSNAVSLLLVRIRLGRIKLQSGKWKEHLLMLLGTPVSDPDCILPPSLRLDLAF